jgi:3-methyladenine DNA glycosylase AlkD
MPRSTESTPRSLTARAVASRLREFSSAERERISRSFFKTGPGQYGDGDIFIGVTVPDTRLVAREFKDLPETEILKLLTSPTHEERLLALILLVARFEKAQKRGDTPAQEELFELYLEHLRHINNWDLVDSSAPQIIGGYLWNHGGAARALPRLQKMARSKDLWERRVAVLATYYFIRRKSFFECLTLSKLLLTDSQDLIHKAVGWMLREIGKRDLKTLLGFLDRHAADMPRTMLRYSIEKLTPKARQAYLAAGGPQSRKKARVSSASVSRAT